MSEPAPRKPDSLPPDPLITEATAWFTRLNGIPSAQERADFSRWQATSADHAAAWARVARGWRAAGDAGTAFLDDPALDAALARIHAARAARDRLRKTTAGMAVLGLLAARAWVWLDHPNLWQDLRADQVTARAERRQIALPDGSRVLLDADTAVALDFAADRRGLRLLRGAAWFQVAPSATPFVVTAGQGRVRVLGTVFDVEIGTDAVNVTLEKSSVEVSGPSAPVRLRPGQTLDYGAGGIAPARPADLAQAASWHEGRFVFNDMTMADVVARIARYQTGRIVILNRALGQRRISGSLRLDDPQAALRALQAMTGCGLHRIGGRLTVLR